MGQLLLLLTDPGLVMSVATSLVSWEPNICQAVGFGIAHWNGVPSGPSGVALTCVYGLLMGGLHEWGGGLAIPTLAHAVADYFIFAVIAARRPEREYGKDD